MTREIITPRVPDGRFDLNGKPYMADAKGGLKPVEMIKAQDLLQDEVTRKIVGYALELSDQIARFKEHTFDDIGGFDAILEQEYGATIGGAKPLHAGGKQIGSANSRRRGVGLLCRCILTRARRSSSTGAKTLRSSAASA